MCVYTYTYMHICIYAYRIREKDNPSKLKYIHSLLDKIA